MESDFWTNLAGRYLSHVLQMKVEKDESGENEGDDDGEEGWIGEDYDDSGDVEYGSRVGGGVGGIAGKSPARLQYEEFLRQLTSKMEAEKGACSLLFVSLISLSL